MHACLAAALGLSPAAFVREVGLLHPPTPATSISPPTSKSNTLPVSPAIYIPVDLQLSHNIFQAEQSRSFAKKPWASSLGSCKCGRPLKQKQRASREEEEVNLVAVLVHKPCRQRQGHIPPLRPRALTIGTQPVLAAALVCRAAWTPPRGKRRRVVWNGG